MYSFTLNIPFTQRMLNIRELLQKIKLNFNDIAYFCKTDIINKKEIYFLKTTFSARGGHAMPRDKVHHACHISHLFPHTIGRRNIPTDGKWRYHNNHHRHTQPNIRISYQRRKDTEFIKRNLKTCKYLVNPRSIMYCILDIR